MIPLFRVNMHPAAHEAVRDVLASGYVGEGKVCAEFEKKFGEAVGMPGSPILSNSCTSSITLALRLCGVRHGDVVVTTPVTCLATNEPVLTCGAKVVWADVCPLSGNIAASDAVFKARDSGAKAVMAVDWGGRPCDYRLLRSANVPVVQDAAHGWEPGDCHGDYVCWSFQAIKFLTCADGGALATPPGQRLRAKKLRWFGLDRESSADFRCGQNVAEAGYKFQSNDVLAAIGLSNLCLVNGAIAAHRKNAAFLQSALAGVPGIVLPPWSADSTYWVYTVLAERREDFIRALTSRGVAASAVHARNDRHDAFAAFRDDCLPGVDAFCSSNCAIPSGWWMTDEDLDTVVAAIKLGW